MAILRIALTALVFAVGLAQGRADDATDRLVTAFAKICYVKPDSVAAIGNLAIAQGFAPHGTSPLVADQNKAKGGFNELVTWRLGSGRTRIDVTAFTAGNAEKRQLGCWVDGGEVSPDHVMAEMTAMLGQPSRRIVNDNALTEIEWTIPAEHARDVVTLFYDQSRGSQRVGLYFDQYFVKPLEKP